MDLNPAAYRKSGLCWSAGFFATKGHKEKPPKIYTFFVATLIFEPL